MSAILNGTPIFSSRVNIVRPVLPGHHELVDGIQSMLSSGMVTKGKFLSEFESAVAEYLNVKHVVGVSSCTTGLMLTYQAFKLSGEVIVPSFTFMATVSALVWCGVKPVFCDVDFGTTNIDPDQVENLISPKTSAIVAVHNFGNPVDIDALEKIASKHAIPLIFDAAHGFGSLYRGKAVGNQGDAQVFSLSPTKLLIAGEGGVVATNQDHIAETVRMGREYGNNGKYDSLFAGLNARLPEFNALLGMKSLENLEKAAENRNKSVRIYKDLLQSVPGISFQEIRQGNRSSYKDLSITIDERLFGLTRDELSQALGKENIDTRKYYDPPVHRQIAYQKYYLGEPLPATENLASHSLSLPIWSSMDPAIIHGICEAISLARENSTEIHQKLAHKPQ
jgi:dTDP-4-amino-4,6-dideoxygalactose transaminase